jgi:hypothetical protein
VKVFIQHVFSSGCPSKVVGVAVCSDPIVVRNLMLCAWTRAKKASGNNLMDVRSHTPSAIVQTDVRISTAESRLQDTSSPNPCASSQALDVPQVANRVIRRKRDRFPFFSSVHAQLYRHMAFEGNL